MRLALIRRTAVGAVIGALAVAAPAGAKTLHGTVVHQNTSESSFVLAARSGNLTVISARRLPGVARIADVKVRRVRAGSATARRIRLRGTATSALLRGRVSFADAHSFSLSANGTSILIQDSGTPPAVGDDVTVRVTFGPGDELDADDVNTSPAPTTRAMKIEGAIQAIDPAARTLTVFADDDMGDDAGDDSASAADDNGPTVIVHVPAGIDITQFMVGDEVELLVTPQGDGSFLLQSVDRDDQGKDDSGGGVQQGDDDGGDQNRGDGGSHSGPGGGGDDGGSGGGGHDG